MNAHPRDSRAAHSVGSVAEEAARIIGLFSGDLDAEAVQAAGVRAAGTPRPTAPACPTCGQEPKTSSSDSVCRVCPVCRVLAVVRSINPDTMERVADVVDLLSDGLRSYAAGRRDSAARETAAREARAAEAAAAAGVRDVTAEFFPDPDDVLSDPGAASADANDLVAPDYSGAGSDDDDSWTPDDAAPTDGADLPG